MVVVVVMGDDGDVDAAEASDRNSDDEGVLLIEVGAPMRLFLERVVCPFCRDVDIVAVDDHDVGGDAEDENAEWESAASVPVDEAVSPHPLVDDDALHDASSDTVGDELKVRSVEQTPWRNTLPGAHSTTEQFVYCGMSPAPNKDTLSNQLSESILTYISKQFENSSKPSKVRLANPRTHDEGKPPVRWLLWR